MCEVTCVCTGWLILQETAPPPNRRKSVQTGTAFLCQMQASVGPNDTSLPSDYNMRIPYGFVLQYYFSKVKQGRLVPVHVRRGLQVYLHFFLTLAVDRGEWSASCSSCFDSQTRTLVPRVTEKRKISCPCLDSTPDCPANRLVTKLTELSQYYKYKIYSVWIRKTN